MVPRETTTPSSKEELINQIKTVQIVNAVAAAAVPCLEAVDPRQRPTTIDFPDGRQLSMDPVWERLNTDVGRRLIRQDVPAFVRRYVPFTLYQLVESYCGGKFGSHNAKLESDWAAFEDDDLSTIGRFLRDALGHSTSGFVQWPRSIKADHVEWRHHKWVRPDADIQQTARIEINFTSWDASLLCDDFIAMVESRFA